jgi:hypothetical protein
VLGCVGLGALVAGIVVYVMGGLDAEVVWAIQVPALLVSGFLVAVGKPEHPIGWLLLVAGLIQAVSILMLLVGDGIAGDLGLWLEAAGNALATMTVLVTPAVLLVFPSGALPSRRWRPLMWLVGLAALVGGTAALITGGWGGDVTQTQNTVPAPLYGELGALGDAFSDLFFLLLLAGMVGAGVGLVVRFRRSRGVERQQMKFLALAATYVVITIGGVFAVGSGAGSLTGVESVLMAVAFAAVPFAVAASVLRYRLWDIDFLINRAVVYAIVLGLLVLVYVIVVVIAAQLVPADGDLPVALSTLATVAAFAPIRRRVQTVMDRWFYRSRYDAARLVDDFLSRLRDEVELEAITTQLHGVVASAVKPRSVGVWMRADR